MARRDRYKVPDNDWLDDGRYRSGKAPPRVNAAEEILAREARVARAYELAGIRAEKRNRERAARPVKPIRLSVKEGRDLRTSKRTINRVGLLERILTDDSLSDRVMKPVRDAVQRVTNLSPEERRLAAKVKLAGNLSRNLDPTGLPVEIVDIVIDTVLRPGTDIVDLNVIAGAGSNWYHQPPTCNFPIVNTNFRSFTSKVQNCATLQAPGTLGTDFWIGYGPFTVPALAQTVFMRSGNSDYSRHSNRKTFWRDATGSATVVPVRNALPNPWPSINPNFVRYMPGVPVPANPRRPSAPPVIEAQQVVFPAPNESLAPPRVPFLPRSPTQTRRRRERKVISRTKAIAIVLFNALDTISEGAEIIDAFYDALPAHRQTCEKDGRGLIDNAGQYGIDRADCKAQQVWKHLAEVDAGLALHNIMKNALEDKLVGAVAGKLPVNIGRANESPVAISNLIDYLFGEQPAWR